MASRPLGLVVPLVLLACSATEAGIDDTSGGPTDSGAVSSSTDGTSSASEASSSSSADVTTQVDTSSTGEASDSSGSTSTGAAIVPLRGGVQKGPLLLGSSLAASRLDADGDPTGEIYTGQLDDDRGRFDLGDVPAGVYLLEAEGFHYDEVRGALSGAPIVLRSVVAVPGGDDIYVNAFTHLAHRRVLGLLGMGIAIDDAIEQAEQELAAVLPIGSASAPSSGAEMTMLGGDDAAARYLFATSAIVGQAATLAAGGGPSDAHLQQLLNQAAAELETDGALEPATLDDLAAGLLALDVAAVEANLAARLLELGIDAETPQLDPVLDQDLDGVMNDVDVCDVVVDPEQLDADGDGLGDACDPYPLGEPEVLVDGLELPWSFAVSDPWIYYSSMGEPGVDDGGLWRIPIDGGAAELVDASPEPRDVAATEATAWWGHLGGISQASFDGASVGLFAPNTARALVVDDTQILWVDATGARRSPLDVATPTLLAPSNGQPYEAAANTDTLYWTTAGAIEAARKDGSEAWTVGAGMVYAAGVVADDQDVFWLDVGTCTIHRAPADDGASSIVWASDDGNDFGHVCTAGTSQIALDETHVYWGGQDVLSRVARDGGEREEIAGDDVTWYVRDVHVDDTHVYWLNHTSVWQEGMNEGSIVRMVKPG